LTGLPGEEKPKKSGKVGPAVARLPGCEKKRTGQLSMARDRFKNGVKIEKGLPGTVLSHPAFQLKSTQSLSEM